MWETQDEHEQRLHCTVGLYVQARQLSVEDDMKPVVECLRKHGLRDRDIAKVSLLCRRNTAWRSSCLSLPCPLLATSAAVTFHESMNVPTHTIVALSCPCQHAVIAVVLC
jgi:hypothetical protein